MRFPFAAFGALSLIAVSAPSWAQAPATSPLLAQDASGKVGVKINSLRWMPLTQFQPRADSLGDNRVLVAEFETVGLAGDWKDAPGKIQILGANARDEDGGPKTSYSSFERDLKTGRTRVAWQGLDPRSPYFKFNWDVRMPNAPANATARTEETVAFKSVPLPASWDGISAAKPFAIKGFEALTQRGTRVVLQSLARSGDSDSEARLTLNFALYPPAKVTDMGVAVGTDTTLDSSGRDLINRNRTQNAPQKPEQDRVDDKVTLTLAPAPGAKTMDLGIKIIEDAPSLEQTRYIRHLELQVDPASIPPSLAATATPVLAQKAGEKIRVTLSELRREQGRDKAYLWIAPLQKVAPSQYAWQVEQIEIRRGDQTATTDVKSRYRFENPTTDLKWHLDGTPIAPGESGFEQAINLPTDAAKTADFVVSATQSGDIQRKFSVKNLKFPTKPGAMLAPRQIITHADGSRLIIWKVGRFDTIHQPLLGPYSMRPGPMKWQGVVVVMEFRPANNLKPNAKTEFSFDTRNEKDDAGRTIGAAFTEGNKDSRFGGHDGDVWKVLPPGATPGAVPAGIKPKFGPLAEDPAQRKRTRQTWYSAFFEVPNAAAKSLNFDVNVTEKGVGDSETVTLKDVPLPATMQ